MRSQSTRDEAERCYTPNDYGATELLQLFISSLATSFWPSCLFCGSVLTAVIPVGWLLLSTHRREILSLSVFFGLLAAVLGRLHNYFGDICAQGVGL